MTEKELKALDFQLKIIRRMVIDFAKLGIPWKDALKQVCQLRSDE